MEYMSESPIQRPEKFLSILQVAEMFGVKKKTIFEWIQAGTLTVYKMGPKTFRIKECDVNAFIEKSKSSASKKNKEE
jgi:excisionase family DNA binding protein